MDEHKTCSITLMHVSNKNIHVYIQEKKSTNKIVHMI